MKIKITNLSSGVRESRTHLGLSCELGEKFILDFVAINSRKRAAPFI